MVIQSLKSLFAPIYRKVFPKSNAMVFDQIYRTRQWGVGDDPNVEFYSGIGSYDPSVAEYTDMVKRLLKELNIRSVVEIGCGDFSVASRYAGHGISYTGIDVVGRLVEHNQRKFASERVNFLCLDASRSKIPAADMCIIRQVLQHLSNKDISAIFRNVSATYLLITEHLPSPQRTKEYNMDKPANAGIRVPNGSGVFIDKPPFNLAAEIILDRNVVSDIHDADDRLVTWLVRRN